MNNLKIRRGQLKSSLTRFWNYVATETNDGDQITCRQNKIEETWGEFQQVQAKIESETANDPEEEAEQEKYRIEFEELYYKAITQANKKINPIVKTDDSGSRGTNFCIKDSVSNNRVSPPVKLAAITIPTFTGSYAEWSTFYDIFLALVHSNDNLTSIEKFFYLRSSLSGEAINCIQNIETTAGNYELAWKALILRYNNEKLLVQSHVKGIFDLEKVIENSPSSLRRLSDSLRGHISALKTLKQRPSEWGPLFVHLICTKLDSSTINEWESRTSSDKIPEVEDLIVYLEKRFQILEAVEAAKTINRSKTTFEMKNAGIKRGPSTSRSTSFVAAVLKCYACGQAHSIYKCPAFTALSVPDRIIKVTDLNLCKICLRKHDGKKCLSRYCFKCNKPHNTMLHLNKNLENKDTICKNEKSDNNETVASKSVTAHVANDTHNVLLATAIVQVIGADGQASFARALLDSASMKNFVTAELAQNLQLKREKVNHMVCGIGKSSQKITSSVNLKIKSLTSDFQLHSQLLVVPKITGDLPTNNIVLNDSKPDTVVLADPSYNIPQKIDILIGAGHFFDIIKARQYKMSSSGPVYQDTEFGYIVSGLIPEERNMIKSTSCTSTVEEFVEDVMQKFWKIEDYGTSLPYTMEERMCEKCFNSTVTRLSSNGRFVVHLPFRNNASKLGESYEIARRRLLSMEKKFERDNNLKFDYVKFMTEYEQLGHMEQVPENEIVNIGKTCYLPHHAVRKENSTSTKLRVVFDASCKTQTGISLNDVLLKGPVLQDDIIYILARFRTHNYVLTSDIVKMYRQVLMTDEHQDFQRILWRSDTKTPIKIFRLKTVTYGTVPASYLATGCLKVLAESIYDQSPEVSSAITQDFYMDDFIGGAETKEDTLKLLNGLMKTMSSAGMTLKKWSSNDIDLIRSIVPSEDIELSNCLEIDGSIKRVLGLFWEAHTDTLKFKIRMDETSESKTISKRKILSDIATIFDPLGLVGPVVVRAKIILQSLWREKMNWDEPIPTQVQKEWCDYRSFLPTLNNLSIPRKIVNKILDKEIEIHGFADASEIAYGCCIYVRVTDQFGIHRTNLLCAKSKVAPLKTLSLPRLELCAALLLARLASKLLPKLQLNIKKRYFWTDSTIVISWISSSSTKWKTFVAHRVSEIQDRTSLTEWQHIGSKENPADIISRGCCPSKLAQMTLWWSGPQWLEMDHTFWPQREISNLNSESEFNIPESKNNLAVCAVGIIKEPDIMPLNRFSSLSKCLRILAYCLRFKNNALRTNKRIIGPLEVGEVKSSKLVLIRLVQVSSFKSELLSLKNGKLVVPKSKLFRLHPFLDKYEIIRVGGRLKNAASIDVYQRHPIVLPAESLFTKMLFREQHERLMHGGPQAVLSSIRQEYWPINGRNIARKTVYECVTCFRSKPIVVQPIMGNLPRDRVEPGRAFLKTGIDFAGPFFIKSSLLKKASIVKSYACIFVCFSTKAVHFELVSDLTTQAFLNALNRFFDRRGKSVTIYTDNATNFVGANNKLKEVYQLFQSEQHKRKIHERLTDVGVTWNFIPPRSPHFGGLWEAAVKSMKNLLGRVLGEAHLTYEELTTVLTRAEACLNSRPITTLSSNPTDLNCLTPGHFLIGDSLTAIPENDVTTIPINRLTRWRRVTQYSQHLWRRWSKEYLTQLQERSKWSSAKGPKLKVGSVVLLREDNLPPLRWRLGVVTKMLCDSDEVSRIVEVKTEEGHYRRAVRNVCPLPFEGNTEEREN